MSKVKKKAAFRYIINPIFAHNNVILSCIIIVIAVLLLSPPSKAEYPYEGYLGHVGDFPDDWTETRYSNRIRDVTHDDDNWYIAQSGCWNNFAGWECVRRLWRIPVEVTLDTNDPSVWWEWTNEHTWVPIIPEGVHFVNFSLVSLQ